MTDSSAEDRILIFAPTGRDAELTCAVLSAADISCHPCRTSDELLREMQKGLAGMLLVEETLTREFLSRLSRAISRQPNWSDVPVLLLTSAGASSPTLNQPIQTLGNITLLERPVRTLALISSVGSALRARKRQYGLREAEQRKDEFLASLGHELRNPLAPIRTSVSVLNTLHPESPEISKICQVVERQVVHLTRLVDDLLDVARITRGKIVLQRATTSLAAVINQAMEICSTLAANAGHRISVTTPPEDVALTVDHARLVQSVANVLANAIKFTPQSGTITLNAEKKNGHVIIRIKDSGIGLDASSLTRIFDLFAQTEVASAQMKAGLGIGLSLAKQFIEMHGGSIRALSQGPGKGSEFIMTIPREVPARQATDRHAPAAPAQPAAAETHRILIVDDNRDAADMLLVLFRSHGFSVAVAYNGEEALLEVPRFEPGVIIMDLGMPGLDGYETARRIRESTKRNLLMIALTGWGQEGSRKKALEAGFDFLVVKPADIDLLISYISQSQVAATASAA